MRFIRLPCIVVLLAISLSSTAQMAAATDSLRAQAARMERAFIAGDFITYVQYFPSKFIQAKGGRDSVVKSLADGRKSVVGVAYDSVRLDAPSGFINENGLLQGILGERAFLTMGHNRVLLKTTLVCLSPDNGAHWSFLEGGEQGGINQLRIWLPDISEKLVIPPQPPPQIFPK
jgi:hypothetical protein